jgi:hypothetical protein
MFVSESQKGVWDYKSHYNAFEKLDNLLPKLPSKRIFHLQASKNMDCHDRFYSVGC